MSFGIGVNSFPSWEEHGAAAPNLSSGLTHYWLLGEASGAARADSVGALTLSELAGGVARATGISGNGASFTGAEFLGNLTANIDTSSFTLSVWVKASSGLATLVWTPHIIIYKASSLGVRVEGAVLGTGPTYNNTWQHVLVWGDGSNASVSINGAAAVTAAYTPGSGAQTLFLNDPDDSVVGVVDELAIWNRPLSAAERTLLYNGGTGTFYPFS